MNRVVARLHSRRNGRQEDPPEGPSRQECRCLFLPERQHTRLHDRGAGLQCTAAKFKRANTVIFGVSRDSIASHEKFKEKQGFPFDLLSDPDEKLCKQFDVIHEKSLYGRKFMGIVRSTFLIDADGKLRQEWRKVKVKGHADEVLEAVKAL